MPTFNIVFILRDKPVISRVDGLLLLISFIVFMWYSFYRDMTDKNRTGTDAHKENTPLWKAIAKVITGLAVLIASCNIFVDKAVMIARSFGVSDAFISLTLIACGTSLPELAASIAAALKKNTQLALGNIIGSNIFNITWILGLSSIVTPLDSAGITATDYLVMTVTAMLPLIFGLSGKINRIQGLIMVIGFMAYTWLLATAQSVQ